MEEIRGQRRGWGFLIAAIVLALLIAFAAGAFDRDRGSDENDDEVTPDEEFEEIDFSDADVRVDSPRQNAVITSPLVVEGEARGNWSFEASFPVHIEDANGTVLTQGGYAELQGNWMTTDYVPFRTIPLAFAVPATETGFIVFEKSNPSGLPENADEIRYPIRFSTSGGSTQTQEVQVFFSSDDAVNTDCSIVTSVSRTIPRTQAVATAAINELLEGVAPGESENLSTAIPDGTKLNSLRIENGTAYADFSAELNSGGGSCSMLARESQIEETLLQFSTVNDVVLSVDGETEEILQP